RAHRSARAQRRPGNGRLGGEERATHARPPRRQDEGGERPRPARGDEGRAREARGSAARDRRDTAGRRGARGADAAAREGDQADALIVGPGSDLSGTVPPRPWRVTMRFAIWSFL